MEENNKNDSNKEELPKSTSPFRKPALEKLQEESVPELVSIVSPKKWVALITIFALVIISIGWAYFGKIEFTVFGKGIYLDLTEIYPLTIPIKGQLLQVPIQIGEHITKDTVVAEVWDETLKKRFELKAPFDAYVADIKMEAGTVSYINQVFAIVQKSERDIQLEGKFYCFIPAQDGDKIKENMLVTIYPWGIEQSVHGAILGYVEHITYLPAGTPYFRSIFLNENFARRLTEEQPLIAYLVSPFLNDEQTEFIWTTKPDANKPVVNLGNFVTTQVLIEKRTPISYLLPRLKSTGTKNIWSKP